MFVVNEDNSIYATRGDIVFFSVAAENNGVAYTFQPGDLVRISVYGKKDAETVVLQKDFPVVSATEKVDIVLTEQDTKFGEVISKPKDYWYEVVLNPFTDPQTIIGYDEDGAKVFKLYPEAEKPKTDDEEGEITPEDIPIIDKELDMTSQRPVENQAIARAVVKIDATCNATRAEVLERTTELTGRVSTLDNAINVERRRIDNLASLDAGSTTGDAELIDIRVAADGRLHDSAGEAVREQIKSFWKAASFITTTEVPITFDTVNKTVTFNGVCRVVYAGREYDCGTSTISYAGVADSAVYVVFNKNTLVAECVAEGAFDVFDHLFLFAFFKQKANLLSGSVTFPNKYRVDDVVCPFEITEEVGRSSTKLMSQKAVTEVLADVMAGDSVEMQAELTFKSGDIHNGSEVERAGDTCYSNLVHCNLFKSFSFDDTRYKMLVCYYNTESYKSIEKFDSWYTSSPFTEIDSGYKYFAIELRTLDGSNVDVTTLQTELALGFHVVQDKTTKEVYVSANGNDNNSGTLGSPYATVQKAIEDGYRNICVMPGVYKGSLSVSNINDLRIYAYNGDAYNNAQRSRPIFTNGDFVAVSETTNAKGIFSFALAEVPASYQSVFIDKTSSPETSGSRPSYGAGLWANYANKYDDIKLKPVLTEAEMSAEQNTFFYDGSNVYVNVSGNVVGFTVVGDVEKVLNFENCNNLMLSGLKVQYAGDTNLSIFKSINATVNDCEFAYTMYSDNARSDYSDVEYNNCLSYKARNDGFNAHYYGITTLNNCRGMYNYDDGESSHEYCEVVVNGGEYAHNGKGGHSPVNGCKFACNNSYTHDNSYGLYLIADESFDLSDSTILLNGCIAIDNYSADIRVENYDVVAMNTQYSTYTAQSGTFTDITNNV